MTSMVSGGGSKSVTTTYSYTLNKNKKISKVIAESSGGYMKKTTYKYKKISYKK